jgi:hypothetical protein
VTFDPAALPDAAGSRWRARYDRLVAALVWSTPAAALLVGVTSLAASTPDDIGRFGLVQALRPELYVCLALLTASFLTVLLVRPSAPGILLAAHVVVLVVLLHGAATILEPLPRFPSAWLHVGFADYIARTGQTLPELDARMSWPGFFALAAMVTRAAGLRDAMPLLGWTPVLFNLLYGVAVYLIARNTTSDRRTSWLAVWLFYPANWVGQDYFAPQALDYLFYLILLVVLLLWFRPSRVERFERGRWLRNPRWRRLRYVLDALLRAARLPPAPMQHEPPTGQLLPRQRVGLMLALTTIFLASTVSHQLTPPTMIASVAVLVIVNRCSVRQLPLLLAVILAGYVSYLTVAYWSGHLVDLLGSLGQVGTTVSSGTTSRVQGDAAHQLVSRARLLLTIAVWCIAAAGAWRRVRRGAGDLALFGLAVAPFLVILLQSYGGEVLLRVYLFVLPAMAVLLAGVVLPAGTPRRRGLTAVLAGLLTLGLIGAFYVTRYGNEDFEQVRPADVDAVNWLYRRAPPGSTLVAVTSNVPWRFAKVEQYEYTPLTDDLGPQELSVIEHEMAANPRGGFLIMSEGENVYAESFFGRPSGWGEGLEQQLLRSARFRLVYQNAGAKIFVLATPRKEG